MLKLPEQVSWLYGKLYNMKATIEIPDELYRETKIAAVMRGENIKDLVAEGLRLVLHSENARKSRKRVKFPILNTGAPGSLDIPDDVAARLDLMEDKARDAISRR